MGLGICIGWLVITLGVALGCLPAVADRAPRAQARERRPRYVLAWDRPSWGYGWYRSAVVNDKWIMTSPGKLVVNARMTIQCRDAQGTVLQTWAGPTRWEGDVPSFYRVPVTRRRLVEIGGGLNTRSLRIELREDGTGGNSLQQWIHPHCAEVLIHVTPLEPSLGEGAARGAGKQRKETRAPVVESAPAGERTERRLPSAGNAYRRPLAQQGGPGRPGGSPIQKRGYLTREQGGVESENARPSGQAYGDPEGRVGGDGNIGDRGARGAMALFGGLMGVPTAIRSAVEVALIMEEANLLSAGKDFVKHRLKSITDVARGRELLFQSAQGHAYKATRALQPELLKDPAFAKLSKAKQERALRVIEWKLQEGYFDSVRQAAEAEVKLLDEAIPQLRQAYDKSKSGFKKRELAVAEQRQEEAKRLIEASKVKPVAGSLPVNHAYAGKELPLDTATIKKLKSQGIDARSVPFTPEGYPDFSRWSIADVRIKLTGKHSKDVGLANETAKLPNRPEEYTWHHHEELGRMQLVPRDLHRKVGHTGGRASYRHVTGNPAAYQTVR